LKETTIGYSTDLMNVERVDHSSIEHNDVLIFSTVGSSRIRGFYFIDVTTKRL
jgi:hypothetical protein